MCGLHFFLVMDCINDYERLATEGKVIRREFASGKIEFVFKDSTKVIFSQDRIEIRAHPTRTRYEFDKTTLTFVGRSFWNEWDKPWEVHWLRVKSCLLDFALDPERERKA